MNDASVASDAPALALENIVAGIGPLTILDGVTLELRQREVVAVLGANGAGKTTLLRTIAGLLAPRSGRISLFGEPIEGRPAHLITRAGIGHVPSGRELFPRLSVADHFELGGRLSPPGRRSELRARILAMFPVLGQRLGQRAGTLSGGEQQRLFVARALLQEAEIYFMDEPFTGVDLATETVIVQLLHQLRSKGKI